MQCGVMQCSAERCNAVRCGPKLLTTYLRWRRLMASSARVVEHAQDVALPPRWARALRLSTVGARTPLAPFGLNPEAHCSMPLRQLTPQRCTLMPELGLRRCTAHSMPVTNELEVPERQGAIIAPGRARVICWQVAGKVLARDVPLRRLRWQVMRARW